MFVYTCGLNALFAEVNILFLNEISPSSGLVGSTEHLRVYSQALPRAGLHERSGLQLDQLDFGVDVPRMQEVSRLGCITSLKQVKAFLNTTEDIQGFVGYSATHNAVIVAFRGTVDIKNWIANADFKTAPYSKCGGCAVHDGFYKGYLEVSATVKAQIQVILNKYRTAAIYVTGHSLGGALATIAALDIKSTFGKVDQFYSYGEPRVGNAAFAAYFAGQFPVYRVVHYADLVPHVPPLGLNNYTHGGSQIWYAENMQTYKSCTAEDTTCADSLPPNALNTKDHDLTSYLTMPGSLIEMLGLRRRD